MAEIQVQLTTLGFDVGPVDGKIGEKTRKAIEAFQNLHQLKLDTKNTNRLLEQLKTTVDKNGSTRSLITDPDNELDR
ncbi:MAG: hypothetical protein GY799_16660 [Desulfobulbaceae bacterium]|nr:hypothetical protein [Desulfobulbaceae bacterium]